MTNSISHSRAVSLRNSVSRLFLGTMVLITALDSHKCKSLHDPRTPIQSHTSPPARRLPLSPTAKSTFAFHPLPCHVVDFLGTTVLISPQLRGSCRSSVLLPSQNANVSWDEPERRVVARTQTIRMDGERLRGEVVMMDKESKEKLEMEEHVPEPKSAHNMRRFVGSQQDIPGACRCFLGRRDKRTWKTVEGGLKRSLLGTVNAKAAQRRVKEYQDKAGERHERSRAQRKVRRIRRTTTTMIQSGEAKFLTGEEFPRHPGELNPCWWPNPIPAIPPNVVRTSHLRGAPTTEETSIVER